ncbi:MAG: HIT family protein [Microscillaceae bacterium]|jgi:histidine triad (HIT) family protein|nr:HIT family protein [Microscillaceae bacterium]
MASIFTKIIRGEIPCYKIAENEHFFAFLDIHPAAPGHTLVVPKLEIDYYFDIPDDLLVQMQLFSKRIALAQKQALACERVGVVVAGFEVPHAHIHLIPSQAMSDMNFANKLQFSAEQMQAIAQKIQTYL